MSQEVVGSNPARRFSFSSFHSIGNVSFNRCLEGAQYYCFFLKNNFLLVQLGTDKTSFEMKIFPQFKEEQLWRKFIGEFHL